MKIMGLKDMMDMVQLTEDRIETTQSTINPYWNDWKPIQKPMIKRPKGIINRIVSLAEKVPYRYELYTKSAKSLFLQLDRLRATGEM
ncbi:gypsy/ty3 element polyprotein [Cucumis melo var. makuwa]|uniref:Gypsy/ty3 element polyprotein n=1 Tax=Cucumis melo var. makuwa TaxID=1194695 RepID=A0A5D3C0P1_CUCMM|nr:gypsy/ty3 element polyprotein [Cucumis melo var. makuwa]